MPLHTGRLVLTPADPLAVTDPVRLRQVLAEAGFIGETLDTHAGRFLIGPGLLDLLTFTGCAVQLETTPADGAGGAFCHVHLPPPTPSPRLLAGRNTRAPRCPACRARLTDWREGIADWSQAVGRSARCPGCAHAGPPWDWDWKQQGGFGRQFVLVEEVFPGEAVPTPGLFDLLRAIGPGAWRHFYVQD